MEDQMVLFRVHDDVPQRNVIVNAIQSRDWRSAETRKRDSRAANAEYFRRLNRR